MDYVKHISTAHSTYSEDSPLVTTIQLTRGRLVGGWIYFPSGPAGKLHVAIRRGLQQILPANQGEDYALDDALAQLNINLDLDGPPLALDIITWNTSTTYAHVCDVCFYVDPFSEPGIRRSWLTRLLATRQ